MPEPMATPEELAARLGSAQLGGFEIVSVYLGDQLGFYRSLSSDGPATSTELAARTGAAERYVREWLEQQATAQLLQVDDPAKEPRARIFSLPEGYEAVFVDPDSPLGMTHAAQSFVATFAPMSQLLAAYRTGAGVAYTDYGADMAIGQARQNRPFLLHQFARYCLPVMPDIDVQLRSDPPARIADIGMGVGWSSIGIALAYPNVLVDGFDLDPYSVELATANAIDFDVADRVRFQCRDAGDPALAGDYDFALAVECIHDMADPVGALAAMRRLVGPGGTVLIVDENAAETFQPDGSASERLLYGYSILHCLPVSLADQPSAATGALMRPDTFRRYAAEAGFASVEILPVENEAFYFYRLTS